MPETKVLTAEEFIKSNLNSSKEFFEPLHGLKDRDIHDSFKNVKDTMIAFAVMHVELALKAASENADADIEFLDWLQDQHSKMPFKAGEDYEVGINRGSILNAYPNENII